MLQSPEIYIKRRLSKSFILQAFSTNHAYMEYGKIIAVPGLTGLLELLSSKNDGAIVRSLEDKSTKFVSSRVHNFSHLESIEVFTVKDNVNLAEVFQAMEKSGTALPDLKDNKALKAYFEGVYPDLDFERVYTSDLKKMVKWYSVLKENEVEIKVRSAEEEPAEEAQAEASAEITEVPVEAVAEEVKPKKAAKKKAVKAENEETSDEGEQKPAKKAAKKKKSED